jgi:diaminopimelate epimerase
MNIPFTKAHGARNDFLLTWASEARSPDLPELARAICDRHTGIGADGWILMERGDSADHDLSITLYNSDGSLSEISGNGTRCAAALAAHLGLAGDSVRVRTGAGLKRLQRIRQAGMLYEFEMDMGPAIYYDEEARRSLRLGTDALDVTIMNVGNPQCVVFVRDFDLDWRGLGARIEHHEWFPNRTNVSFVRAVDRETIDVRFWERGAGETMSSGTGSTGAAFASHFRGLVGDHVRVMTPAGDLHVRFDRDSAFLTGPAELIGTGEFFTRR